MERVQESSPEVMHKTVADQVFPFLRGLGTQVGGRSGSTGSTYSDHMKDARFTIPTPALLSKVVDMLDDIQMADRDTYGDLYEYLLSKIASAGVNGQFRTPRHIIELMVTMTAPKPTDKICDPACGTGGFLVAASEYVRDTQRRRLARLGATRALPPLDVPRLRLRLHHAPRRQHEHAAARHRFARHPLSRLSVRRGGRPSIARRSATGNHRAHASSGPARTLARSRRAPRLRRYDESMAKIATSARTPLSGPMGKRVAAHRSELHELLRRHGVTNPEIFGSAARSDDREDSDIDLLVDFAPGTSIIDIIGIQRELAELLGVPVDLVPRNSLKDRVRARVQNDLLPL
ncbi:MAG: N-6 DNA methylase [Nocardioides sp.]